MEVKIISLVRDPVARNISAFFHDFEDWAGKPLEQISGGIEQIKRIFLEQFDHDYTLRWFDRLEDTLGVNVYNHPFPREGYNIVRKGKMSILIMRLELDDKNKQSKLKSFFGNKKIRVK